MLVRIAPLFLPSHHSGLVTTSSPPSWLKRSSECVIWMCRAFLLLTKMKSYFYSLKHVHAHIHTLPHPLTPTHTCTHHFNSKPRSMYRLHLAKPITISPHKLPWSEMGDGTMKAGRCMIEQQHLKHSVFMFIQDSTIHYMYCTSGTEVAATQCMYAITTNQWLTG